MGRPVIMLVAAEASGDVLGADLIAALRTRLPQADFVGLGGPRMTAAGVVSPFDIGELSIFGVFEALAAYPKVMRRLDEVVALAMRERFGRNRHWRDAATALSGLAGIALLFWIGFG